MSIDIYQTKYIPISPLRPPAQNLKINIRHIPMNSSVLLIPIPKLLPYGLLMKKIDVGEFYSIRETLCHDLPPDQQVDGVYRNLENFLLLLAKFYFETDQYRKQFVQLNVIKMFTVR